MAMRILAASSSGVERHQKDLRQALSASSGNREVRRVSDNMKVDGNCE
jgi:hypothetical protein